MSQELLIACAPIVNNSHWDALEQLLTDYIKAESATLLTAVDIGTVREVQGKIKAYRRLLELKQSVTSAIKG